MKAIDALGNEIIIGQKYGYSQQSNGSVTIVTGFAEKVNELKATLSGVNERRGMLGSIENKFHEQDRKRSVNACHLFPVYDVPVVNDWNDLQVLECKEFDSVIRRNFLKANYSNGVIIRK